MAFAPLQYRSHMPLNLGCPFVLAGDGMGRGGTGWDKMGRIFVRHAAFTPSGRVWQTMPCCEAFSRCGLDRSLCPAGLQRAATGCFPPASRLPLKLPLPHTHTHSNIPHLHRHISFAHLSQVVRNRGDDVFRPLPRAKDVDEAGVSKITIQRHPASCPTRTTSFRSPVIRR